ncbi:gluconate 2-dehydrogenase subunit 3 family protein [Hephaestia sp. GCM10023244]|uniref:gluconate 2-dehydrogenase subunit 3 family protein n=1 Tax=unclassified Hephaestia TaxID=2631281 RepID=UPI0020777901|nr:gluconate 2-dehydrogenase subunit 3 family protein [Hephaestia sp. MAHUQ-44]MCM8732378.1 gluconate 2-dehydrogenase subunit 3 family protein [Hephaestia sp. MAHUQ-44]
MADRFPDYDVLAKRDTPSWNPQTRKAIDERIATAESDVLTPEQRATLRCVVDRIVPQPADRQPVNAAALVLHKIMKNSSEGFRHHRLPPVREAWQRGLDAIDAEACATFGRAFTLLGGVQADAVLRAIERGETQAEVWADLPPELFWNWRLIPDIVSAYYAHPSAWSAMGFGGPASPRGYVRLRANRRDPWEAREAPA